MHGGHGSSSSSHVQSTQNLSAHEGSTESVFNDPNSMLSSHLVDKMSICREESCNVNEWVQWDEHPKTQEEIQAIWQKTKEATSKREKDLALALFHQNWRTEGETVESEEEVE
ncbi:uncharacterized protein LOC120202687 [Hibiscus syriacus]|uniref:uncharacterized protein LOC120202687 n=1 Tax=Hibiscus syriacus TaxID=106335 RepID=UPI0019229E2E|nr:uncharacterized protein LOC120202687 [Hibiscus syriacus]